MVRGGKHFEFRVWAMYLKLAPLGAPLPDVSEEQEESARRALFWQAVKMVQSFDKEMRECLATTTKPPKS